MKAKRNQWKVNLDIHKGHGHHFIRLLAPCLTWQPWSCQKSWTPASLENLADSQKNHCGEGRRNVHMEPSVPVCHQGVWTPLTICSPCESFQKARKLLVLLTLPACGVADLLHRSRRIERERDHSVAEAKSRHSTCPCFVLTPRIAYSS